MRAKSVWIKALGVTALLGLLPGCATITRGTKQSFVVESEPPNADVEMSNGLRCRTPCSLKLKRKDGFTVKISKQGYEPVEATVTSQMAGGGGAALAGNILLGGLIGAGVDGSNGSTNELKPNPLKVKLEPISSSPVTSPPKP